VPVCDGDHDLGHRAISLTGSQAGIVTDTSHTKARILDVRADRITTALAEDQIVLVAGFQGVSTASGRDHARRGGSDTTAVALAAAVWGPRNVRSTPMWRACSAPIRRSSHRRKLRGRSAFEAACSRLAASGAGVLQLRSVEYARNHGVAIHCRSSFDDAPGTLFRLRRGEA